MLEARARVIQAGAIVIQNASGTNEVILGQQADGTYGLKVLNGAGVLQAVQGAQSAVGSDVLSNTSLSWQLSAGSLVTCNISSSGLALVCAEASINLAAAAGSSVLIGISVDSVTPVTHAVGQFTIDGTTNNPSVSLVRWDLISGLSQGSHTFQVGYKNVTANAANYLGPQAIVIPF